MSAGTCLLAGIIALAAAGGASCALDRQGLLRETIATGGQGAATSSGGASTGTASPGGHGGTATGIGGGPGGAPPTGGGAPVLVDDGLLVRYHIDEASSGSAPTTLLDSAPSPRDLGISYSAVMSFTEVNGNRALQWASPSAGGSAWTAVDSTKIKAALQGSTAGTIEVVIAITGVSGFSSRLSHIGLEEEWGRFTLTTSELDRMFLVVNGALQIGNWAFPLASSGRTVLHAVFESSHANAAERARLYADGVRIAGNIGALMSQHLALDLDVGRHFVLGNRQIGGRSFQGQLYYAALYSSALSDVDIAHNATLLLLDDDSP